MAWRFQRRLKILPGVTLNIGKRGVSASIGPRGAKVTLHSDGSKRTTVGLPGSGLSTTSYSSGQQLVPTAAQPHIPSAKRGRTYLAILVVIAFVFLWAFLH